MNKEIFVQELMKLAPSVDDLSKRNLSKDYIDEFINSYTCYPKNDCIKIYSSDELLILIQTYDCSKVQIGIISFLNSIVEHEDYFEIGEAEQDILAINKVSMEVQVLDGQDIDYVIWPCASSGAKFLQAMLSAADFFTSKIKTYPFVEPGKDTVLKWVQKCTQEAGGDRYKNFYEMLLGYF